MKRAKKFTARFPISDWRYELSNGDTKLGYKEWLSHKIEDWYYDQKHKRKKTNPRRRYRVRKNYKKYSRRSKASRRKSRKGKR